MDVDEETYIPRLDPSTRRSIHTEWDKLETRAKREGRWRELRETLDVFESCYYSPLSIWELVWRKLTYKLELKDLVLWGLWIYWGFVASSALPLLVVFIGNLSQNIVVATDCGPVVFQYVQTTRAKLEIALMVSFYLFIGFYVRHEVKEARHVSLALFLGGYYRPYGRGRAAGVLRFVRKTLWILLVACYIPLLWINNSYSIEHDCGAGPQVFTYMFFENWQSLFLSFSSLIIASARVAFMQDRLYGFIDNDELLHPIRGAEQRQALRIDRFVTAEECEDYEANMKLHIMAIYSGVPPPRLFWNRMA